MSQPKGRSAALIGVARRWHENTLVTPCKHVVATRAPKPLFSQLQLPRGRCWIRRRAAHHAAVHAVYIHSRQLSTASYCLLSRPLRNKRFPFDSFFSFFYLFNFVLYGHEFCCALSALASQGRAGCDGRGVWASGVRGALGSPPYCIPYSVLPILSCSSLHQSLIKPFCFPPFVRYNARVRHC